MLADLNKMVFSAAPHLRRDWAEAQRRRQGRQSVAPKGHDARLWQGTTLWTSA